MSGEPYIAMAGILSIIVIVILEIAFRLVQEDTTLKLFFIWLSIIFTIPIAQIAVQIATVEVMADSILNLLVVMQYSIAIIGILTTAYFMVYSLNMSLQAMPVKNKLRLKA
jgi:hypothetical protein